MTESKKYPRTPHIPGSPGATSDDKILKSLAHLIGREVVFTEKMDGENTTLARKGFHARSLDSRHHPSRDWVARFHAEIAHEIPEGWRICGENVYARHSIAYAALPSYFMGFSVWNEKNVALSWDETEEWFELLGVSAVPVLWRGPLSEKAIETVRRALDLESQEGFVVRLADAFHYDDFARSIAKYVRKGHVQTDLHWMHQEVVPNGLAASAQPMARRQTVR